MLKESLAPAHIMRASLRVLYFAAFTTRNWALDEGISRQQIYDLWEAVHDVPSTLLHWREGFSEEWILSHLREYNERWPRPQLRAIYDQAIESAGPDVPQTLPPEGGIPE